ncbi:hypothetical protein JCM16303_007231 [Sporobolomyces ruberrimus]
MRLSTSALVLFSSLHALISIVHAAPAATARMTLAPSPCPTAPLVHQRDLFKRKDDVIVNIGAVTTQTTVVQTAVPTTVFVEITTEGKVITSTVVSTEVTKVETVVTQTAVETQIVKETVQQGVTVPVTLTTTGYELDIQTQVVQVQSTVLETQVNVVTNTILGFENVDTETVVQTKTQGGGAEEEKPTATDKVAVPTETNTKSVDDGQYTPEETSSATKTSDKPAPKTVTDSTSSPGSTATILPGLDLNNTAEADADASASLSNENSNSNSVSVDISSDSGESWISQGNNGWYLGGGIAIVVLIIVAILIAVCACGNNRSGGGGGRSSSSNQSVYVSNPPSFHQSGGVAPQPVMSSLASRPRRKAYAQVGRDAEESSEFSGSSSEEEVKPVRRSGSARTKVGRTASRSSRR